MKAAGWAVLDAAGKVRAVTSDQDEATRTAGEAARQGYTTRPLVLADPDDIDGWDNPFTMPAARKARRDAMWVAILTEAERLKEGHDNHGSSRSAAMYDGLDQSSMVTLSLGRSTGESDVYVIRAYARHDGTVTVTREHYVDNRDGFWSEQLEDRSNAVVVGGSHYRIRTRGIQNRDGSHLGFAGAVHRIRMFGTDEVVTTNDLWWQGVIPPAWRDRIPDNAEFLDARTT